LTTFHIHIQGIVQGVGFRPFVFKLAKINNFNGWVNNSNDGVHIEINATKSEAKSFHNSIIKEPPELAKITQSKLYEIEQIEYTNFEIVRSESNDKTNVLLTPDFGICSTCRSEINKPNNKRYNYAFTTCINCGPRFSIISKLPYDRESTTMDSFEMCESCDNEYNNPQNRRYYSQTNSCPKCSIKLSLLKSDGILVNEGETSLNDIVGFWNEGKIVAIKGVGGFLLTCDATNKDAIE